MKLAYSEARQRFGELCLRVLDRDALHVDDNELVEERLRTLALTIAAGASQIQRNIIGERVLGLPKEAALMDLDLSDDQVALRDGIAVAARRPVRDRPVRAGFDRALFDELADAGVFSLRADGFCWADCVVVFEQLGRFCVPGPLVASLLARRRPDRGVGRTGGRRRSWVEHLDALDDLFVLRGDELRRVDPTRARRRPVAVAARSAHAGRARARPARRRAGRRRRSTSCDGPGAVLTAALQLGLADRCTELAVAYAKERVQFDRPIAGVPGDQAHARRHARAHRGRACRGLRGGRGPRRDRDSARRSTARSSARRSIAGEAAIDERQGGHAGVRRHGLHVGGRRAPLPEAGVGARHAFRFGATQHCDVVGGRGRSRNLTLLSRP